MAIRFEQAAPFVPDWTVQAGAAEQYTRTLPAMAAQQQALVRLYEEQAQRAQQNQQFVQSQRQQAEQFGAGLGQRAYEYDTSRAQQDWQFGVGLDQRAIDRAIQDRQFGAGLGQRYAEMGQQDRQFGANLGQRAYEFGAGQQFQAQRDVFGAQQQQARDVFDAQRQMGMAQFGAQQQMSRDVFGAQAQEQMQQQRFQLQAELQQTELSQAEQMRLQRMQGALDHVMNDNTLTPQEQREMATLIRTGHDPLARRQSQAQILHMQNQDMTTAAAAQMQNREAQRRMNYFASTLASRRVTEINPYTGQEESFLLDINGMPQPFNFQGQQPRMTGSGGGSGSGGGRGADGRLPPITPEQLSTLRAGAEATMAARNPGFASLPQAEREAAIQGQLRWSLEQLRMANEVVNPPPPAMPTPAEQRRQQQQAIGDWHGRILNDQGRPPGQRLLAPQTAAELTMMLHAAGQHLERYGSVQEMPPAVQREYMRIGRTLDRRVPEGPSRMQPPDMPQLQTGAPAVPAARRLASNQSALSEALLAGRPIPGLEGISAARRSELSRALLRGNQLPQWFVANEDFSRFSVR